MKPRSPMYAMEVSYQDTPSYGVWTMEPWRPAFGRLSSSTRWARKRVWHSLRRSSWDMVWSMILVPSVLVSEAHGPQHQHKRDNRWAQGFALCCTICIEMRAYTCRQHTTCLDTCPCKYLSAPYTPAKARTSMVCGGCYRFGALSPHPK